MYHAALILLGPLLYAQGKYVRRVAPELPEGEGEREGRVGFGQPLSLLIAGDSAAAGVGVDHQDQALSGRLVAALCVDRAVSWRLLATSGDASRELLEVLQAQPLAHYDTVVLSIGVNDVTGLTSSRVWVKNLEDIITVLGERFGAGHIILSSIPPMHLFPALPQPLRWWLGLRARQFNRLMESVAGDHACCSYAAIPYPNDRADFIAPDGFHPGELAYSLWGEHLAALIKKEVAG